MVDRTGEFQRLVGIPHSAPPDTQPPVATEVARTLWRLAGTLTELQQCVAHLSVVDSRHELRAVELIQRTRRDLTALQEIATQSHAGVIVPVVEAHVRVAARQFQQLMQQYSTKSGANEQRRRYLGAPFSDWSQTLVTPPPPPHEGGNDDELRIMVEMEPTATSTRMTERRDQIRTIERDISQVRTLFQQLAAVVAQQTEQIARIEDNIMHAQAHTAGAHRQLTRYLESIQHNRWLAAKLVAVTLFFVVVFLATVL